MVNFNNRNPLSQGGFCPPRDNNWTPRIEIPQESRYSTALGYNAPQPVGTALNDGAKLEAEEWVLMVFNKRGEFKDYSSPNLDSQRIITDRVRREFEKEVRRVRHDGEYPNSAYPHTQEGMYSEFEDSGFRKQSSSGGESSSRSRNARRRRTRSEDSDEVAGGKRKRTEIDTPVTAQHESEPLRIGDSREVEKFYTVRFKDMQQASCKVMGKAFVKLMEPKKQTHHPYTKGVKAAPPWWPNTSGENSVRHREPDHLLKPERIQLLVHILKLIVEPVDRQHASVRKLGLNVKKLKAVTMEAMSIWFNDKDHPENRNKRRFLKEIFKVAETEERFKAGEIDASFTVYVMCGDRASGNDSEDEGDALGDDDEEEGIQIPNNVASTPESLVSPTMLAQQSQFEPQTHEFLQHRNRPTLVSHQSAPATNFDHPPYVDPAFRQSRNSFQSQSPIMPHDSFRPAPYAPSPYPSPHQTAYNGSWPQNMGSSGPMHPGSYMVPVTSSPQTSFAPSYQLPAPTQQSIQHPRPFDTLHNLPRYDVTTLPGPQMRHNSIGQPQQMSNDGLQTYLQDSNPFGTDMKEEQHHRQS
ncbi:hypothetical protein B0J14DRAFT_218265 [Halenospora varia]|nr:hypothetical protein B0J14DRAFT_218265 [Halenospora varia]